MQEHDAFRHIVHLLIGHKKPMVRIEQVTWRLDETQPHMGQSADVEIKLVEEMSSTHLNYLYDFFPFFIK